ncbi:(d)CMP kinase [Pontiella sulfatireligans]|uniref:Cytidylate kinase n=1 Tax=Pontiella sulfatireligans TaxID=2750658 RepID=A0A6C2ULV5_9BACT|nr:(d)CMP kinase [Pontiella sulfatireligans]VGO20096.1 Cytidylate kinase [Pontiella sulfatireligans]
MGKAIAIDGPSASGKSSVSKGVAAELGFMYVDSGALYRGVTWQAIRKGVDATDAAAVLDAMHAADWDFFVQDGAAIFSVDGDVPVQELREKDVRESVAHVAAIPEVRKFVVESLQSLENFGSLVMEGRDIGTVVFPDSPYKFYLDADPEERAMRRYRELVAAGEDEKAHEVMDSLKKRDKIDSTRKTDPLVVAPGAQVIDSTLMTLEEVIQTVVDSVRGE